MLNTEPCWPLYALLYPPVFLARLAYSCHLLHIASGLCSGLRPDFLTNAFIFNKPFEGDSGSGLAPHLYKRSVFFIKDPCSSDRF